MFVLYARDRRRDAAALSRLADAPRACTRQRTAPLGPSRAHRLRLAALFSLDSFGGGFVVQSLLALWLFQRFELSLAAAGTIFFWTGLCPPSPISSRCRIAERIGLVNTMVFTHLPSSLLPDRWRRSCPAWRSSSGCCCVRSLLSQMDVPTRNSYVMAVVTPQRAAGGREHHVGAAQPRVGDRAR